MAKKHNDSIYLPENAPAVDPYDRETQMISLATTVAEQQLRDGTASPSVIVHFLKLATMRERTEMEILEKKKELISAQTETLQSAKRVEELYSKALNAMRSYSGQTDESDSEIF